jgi:hypothetical protein
MRIFAKTRWIFLALLFAIALPISSFAGVFISVGIAPPPLPVYEQPPCPEPGWMWAPGYWAYGPDGYYWVPGQWVPAPYQGALWTPPYWGWEGGFYVFHPGYWGRHVGYYGGVNYGFGYMGVGFVGGAWQGGFFRYNTAIVRVDERRIHNVYVDRDIIRRNTIVNDRHIAYSGGPGGVRHDPRPEERAAMHEQHMAPTSYQANQERNFRSDRNAYATNNGGRPQTPAMARPQGYDNRNAAPNNRSQAPAQMQQPNRSAQGFQNTPQNQRQQGNSANGAQFNNRSMPSNQSAAPQRSMQQQQPGMQQQRSAQPSMQQQPQQQRMTQPSAQQQHSAQPQQQQQQRNSQPQQQNRGQEQHESGGRDRR